jgi:hypothetical protein
MPNVAYSLVIFLISRALSKNSNSTVQSSWKNFREMGLGNDPFTVLNSILANSPGLKINDALSYCVFSLRVSFYNSY